MALARYQFQEWRHRPPQLTAKGFLDERLMKIDDDCGNAAQMVFFHFKLTATPLTPAERLTAAIPPELRYAHLLENSPFELGLAPEQEMAHLLAIARAKKKVAADGIEYFDEFGGRIRPH